MRSNHHIQHNKHCQRINSLTKQPAKFRDAMQAPSPCRKCWLFSQCKLEFSLVLVALETPSTTYKMADRHQRFQETTSYNLGQNKMEQQTPVPPKSRVKPREGQKRAVFPSLIWEGGGGGSRFSIYVVQDCSFLMG